jgi:pheromone shutdown-related protein TraB
MIIVMISNTNKHQLSYEDKEVTLLGTAHVSRESAELVSAVIDQEKPDTVCIELCESRYQSITQRKKWQERELIKVIKEKKAFVLLSNLMLAYFQKRIGQRLGIKPGEEIIRATQAAEAVGARIWLADRDIRTTLSRTWRLMGFWKKITLLLQIVTSAGDFDSVSEEEIEKMKTEDVLEVLLTEIGESFPEIRKVLIDERDQYLAHQIRTAPGKRIVAVVGAGHVPGIQRNWESSIDLAELTRVPPKGKVIGLLKWGIPMLIIALIVVGFVMAGTSAGTHMIKWWVIANASLAGLGAAIALGHPLTILTAIGASPLSSLNPMMAAGWFSGLVEVFMGKPKVRDFEGLPDDISTLRGFWRNKIIRVLLVVVFTNIGSSLGAFVAIPLMLRVFA